MKTDNRRFRCDSGMFKCRVCGKNTRETGGGESFVGLCAYCYQEGLFENALSDGDITEEQFNKSISELKKRYRR